MANRHVWEKWSKNSSQSTGYRMTKTSDWDANNTHTGNVSMQDTEGWLVIGTNAYLSGSSIKLTVTAYKKCTVAGMNCFLDVSAGTYFGIVVRDSNEWDDGSISAGTAYTCNVLFYVSSGSGSVSAESYSEVAGTRYSYAIRNTSGISAQLVKAESYAQTIYSKGTTSYGNVSAASSGAYPSNSYSGNYWYVYRGYDCIDPSTVSYSTDAPRGGETIDITVTPRANTYGGTIKYKYEYSLDGGVTWTVANSGTTSTTVSVLIPAGSTQFQARVTASDDTGFTSTTAVSGAALTVTNNTAPVITCNTTALGEISAAFSVPYSVSDADGNTMTVTEKLDNTVLRSYTTTGGDQTLIVNADRLLRTLNGSHTLTITADDGNGGVTTHSISFTKAVYACSITLLEPLEADDLIRLMVMNIARSIPDDAIFQVFACNNGFDDEPTWEEITSFVLNGYNYSFVNTNKTADKWGFNFKIIASRAPGGQGGYIESVSGGFEG